MSVNPEAFAELSAALARYGATSNDVSKALTDVGKALREAKVTPQLPRATDCKPVVARGVSDQGACGTS